MLRSGESGIDLLLQTLVFGYLCLQFSAQIVVFFKSVFDLLCGRFEFLLGLFSLSNGVSDSLILGRRNVVRRSINCSWPRWMSSLRKHQIKPLRLHDSVIPMRLVHAVLPMRQPADIVNVHFGLGDDSVWIDRLNFIDKPIVSATAMMNYRDFALVLCRHALGR